MGVFAIKQKTAMGTHKDLIVWQNSMLLVNEVYRITRDFPKSEQFGITDQVRRAAISVPANISEGSARLTPGEFHHFLRISFGSLTELETLLQISLNLGYLKTPDHENLQNQIILLTSLLTGLIRAINRKKRPIPSSST